MIPTRQLHSLCTWCIRNKYRTGDGCDYAGTRYFDKNNNPVSDPSLDECNGTLTACKLRSAKITNSRLVASRARL
jgi:lambda family phage minor tail protein L